MSPSEYSQEHQHFPPDAVTVFDNQGRSLPCFVEHSFQLQGQNYALLVPVDLPVEIFAWWEEEDGEEREEPVPVDSEDELNLIFPTAKAVLEEENLNLQRTAVTLTVSGELPDFDDNQNFGDSNVEENGDGDYEEFHLLASFYHEEQEYGIYTPLDPYLILARLDKNGKPELLSDEEIQQLEPLMPTIEAMLEEQLFDDLD
ncbi:DUF3727 domain-containing protein [Geitlerinema sp. PCC 9228]|jgi:uncharacterized protein YrzB (UPF0473 family)|uniref:DUF3727 domain-containing protein n=1 Tax=Geitlerinema sp. PCC 9228 TaxID=111611 RepID=UPI0008F9A20E|nr:DUF3727 domain-containing protein [Geitlerinema sp. PCC 9228]